MKVPFMDLCRMHEPIKDKINREISKVIEKGDFILGGKVEEFEKNYAAYCGTGYAAGTSTGTDALELILRALDIGEGDEVITAPNSFIATASAISSVGATPIFADVFSDSRNINPEEIKKRITNRTRAIMPVHLYGKPAMMDEMLKVGRKEGLKVIEDACQAHGAKYNGTKVGGWGDAAAFSFYPAKNLGGFGDGGMAVSDDRGLIDKIKMLRNYGQSKKYHHDFFAFNMRLDTIQAAILNAKLDYLDEWNSSRRNSAEMLNEKLEGIVRTPQIEEISEDVFHLYVIQAADEEERDNLGNFLNKNGIGTGMHYPVPIHLQKAYSYLNLKEGIYPVSEKLCKTGLSLPIFPYMKTEEVEYVGEKIKEFYS